MAQGLPPGIFGYQAGVDANQRQQAGQLQQLGILAQLQAQQEAQAQAREMRPLQLQELKAKVAQAEQMRTLRSGILAQMQGGSPEAALSQGAAVGDVGPTVTNAQRMSAPGQSIPTLPRELQLALMSGDPGLKAWAMEQAKFHEPRTLTEGGGVYVPGRGMVAVRPKIGEGMQATGYSQSGELTGVQPIPGYMQGRSGIVGAEETAQQGARAASDVITVKLSDGSERQMSRADFLRLARPAAPQPAQPVVSPSSMQISPAVQAQRDAEASRIRTEELKPGGGSLLPSGPVLGQSPTATQQAETAGLKEYFTKTAEGRAKLYTDLNKASLTNPAKIAKLERIGTLLSDYNGGKLAPLGVELANLGVSAGINLDSRLPNKQAAEALSKEVALELRGTGACAIILRIPGCDLTTQKAG